MNEIYELWEQGYSVNKIAKATGIDEATVTSELEKVYYVHSHNPVRSLKPFSSIDELRELAKTKTISEIAEWYGVPYTTVRYHLKKHGILPATLKRGPKNPQMSDRSKAIIDDIKNADGKTLEQIGKKYGVSRQRVHQIKKILEQRQQ